MRTPLLLPSLLLLLAGPAAATAAAQGPTPAELKAARAQLAKVAKAVAAEHAADLNWRLKIVRGELDALAAQLHDEPLTPEELVAEVGASWAGFMQTLSGYGYWAQQDLEAAAVELLSGFAEAPATVPRDFGTGDGGRLDRVRAALQRNVDRSLRRAVKLHAAWAAKLAAQHGLAVNLLLEPVRLPAIAPGLEGASPPAPPFGMVIEVLVAASALTGSGDGALHASGVTTGDGAPVLDVILLHPSGMLPFIDVPLDDDRFAFVTSELAEDSYKVMTSKDGFNLVRSITVP